MTNAATQPRNGNSEPIGRYVHIRTGAPDAIADGAELWFAGAAAMTVVRVAGSAGAGFARDANPDEYFVWALDAAVEVITPTARERVASGSVVIVPPGESRVQLAEAGSFWLGFTSQAADLVERASKSSLATAPPKDLLPVEPWPMPPDGYRIRVYDLDTCAPVGARRCFRHRTAMTNMLWPSPTEPRDPRNLSPHYHDDFEQVSIIYAGSVIHHMRRTWRRDSTQWVPDEHVECHAPAVIVSPPPDIHTTQAIGTTGGRVGLVDFFAPPRWDFSQIDGMVVNALEYPQRATAPAPVRQAEGVYASDDPRAPLNVAT